MQLIINVIPSEAVLRAIEESVVRQIPRQARDDNTTT